MDTIVLIATGVVTLLYAGARLLVPVAPRMSAFELAHAAGTGEAVLDKRRGEAVGLLSAVRNAASLVLVLTLVLLLAALMNGFAAATVTVLVALIIEKAVRLKTVRSWGDTLYERVEGRLLRVTAARRYLFFLPVDRIRRPDAVPSSEAELLHMVDRSSFLEHDRRDLIRSALEFTGLTAADAMSGRRSITPVDKGEVLGPLLLDELYKTGRQAFVVTDGGIDDIIGVLKLEKLTSLDLRDTPTALKAMSPDVHAIDRDAPVTEALAYLRSAKAPFLVVRDETGKTAGLLTMDNILRCLFAD